MREAADDPDWEVRRAGLVALADRGAVGPVADFALRSPSPDTRAVAVELLVEAPDAARPTLERYLEPEPLAQDAGASLWRILEAASEDERRAAVAAAVEATGDEARQVQAAGVLGTLRDVTATPALIELLHAGEAPARAAAATALGQIQDPRAAQILVTASSDEDAAVSAAARQALAGLGRAASYAYAALPGAEAGDSRGFAESVGALLESTSPHRIRPPAPQRRRRGRRPSSASRPPSQPRSRRNRPEPAPAPAPGGAWSCRPRRRQRPPCPRPPRHPRARRARSRPAAGPRCCSRWRPVWSRSWSPSCWPSAAGTTRPRTGPRRRSRQRPPRRTGPAATSFSPPAARPRRCAGRRRARTGGW